MIPQESQRHRETLLCIVAAHVVFFMFLAGLVQRRLRESDGPNLYQASELGVQESFGAFRPRHRPRLLTAS